jgi:Sulfite reductase, alpha subunit (flavoprotein)
MSSSSPSLDGPKNSPIPVKVSEPTCTTSLLGTTVIRQLLPSHYEMPNKIDKSLLPTLGSKLSSCQLYNEDEQYGRKDSRGLSLSEVDKVTISSCTSSNLHYTMNEPFESTILGARYLTNTSVEGAKFAAEILENAYTLQDGTFDSRYSLAKKKIQEYFNLKSEDGSKHGKRVIEMKLSLPDDFSLDFQPGDSIGMVVSNTDEAVTFVLDMLEKEHGLPSTQQIILDNKRPVTVAYATSNLIDLCSPIKNKRILLSLSQFATDDLEAETLKLLSSKDPVGQDLFKKYVDEQRLSMVDILKVFPSCQKIPVEGLFSILPSLAPRYYSISSSPLNQEKNLPPYLTITYSVVDYVSPVLKLNDGTPLQRRVSGLTTSHLEVLCAPHLSGRSDNLASFSVDRVKLFPKPAADFRLPPVLSDPMLLIGPGTGVAPFIGFLRHREAQLMSTDSTKLAKVVSEGTWRGGFEFEKEDLPVTNVDAKGLVMGADYRQDQRIGDIALYFGCRFQDHDWLYKSEMEEFRAKGILSHLGVAFSRDSMHPKYYVQDKLRNDAHLISKMITEQNAYVYICGDGNAMAKDVQNALVDILAQHLFGENADATSLARDYLSDLKSKKKLLLDVWS